MSMKTNLKPLVAKLSTHSRRALEAAANMALIKSHYEVDLEHFLLALLDDNEGPLTSAFTACDISPSKLREFLERNLSSLKYGNNRNPVLSKNIMEWLENAWLFASLETGHSSLCVEALVVALLSSEDLLRHLGDASALFSDTRLDELRLSLIEDRPRDISSNTTIARIDSGQRTSSSTPHLDKYTIDLTAQARRGEIDRVIGRDGEIRQIVDILLRRRQNNPILTGEPGVGKTAVVEGLALQIAEGNVPHALRDTAVRTLDLGLLQAGASIKGEFESRLRGVIDEVKGNLIPTILFIDEAHTMIGAGGQAGQNDAANLLKPALARGELRTIAATTWSEYKRYFEKDAALARRFQVVKIDEPSVDAAIQMLRSLVPMLEGHHGVRILDSAVISAVKLSARYVSGRQLPDKCVSLLDTACSRVALSIAAKPACITDLNNLLTNLDREESALLRENLKGTHDLRLGSLRKQRDDLKTQLDILQTNYEAQRQLVNEIQGIRREHCTTTESPDGAHRAGTYLQALEEATSHNQRQRFRLEAALESLRELHRDHVLVYECVDENAVSEIVSSWTGVPLGRMVSDELAVIRDLEQLLGKRVIGQDHVLQLISRRVRISKANLEDPNKPKGVFLLVGPSGVGKTETALALADTLYGGERNLITINMSEYQESHSVAGLKGSPPGYIGYGEGGVLSEAVRRKPYSVVLLDEVEKAHPDVLELFFQIFDKGFLDDSDGNPVDFRNTIIILTSNVGSSLISNAVDNGIRVDNVPRDPTPEDLVQLIRDDLQRHFKPAFLGRLNVVPYYPIDDSILREIVTLKLDQVVKRIYQNHNAVLTIDKNLVELIALRCTDVDSGARNADAVISDQLLTPISVEVLAAMAKREEITNVSTLIEDGALFISTVSRKLNQ